MTDNPERLAAVGAVDPDTGYPLYYEDRSGLRLDLGLGPDPRLPAVGEIPQPGLPLVIPGNFPDESFYFLAESRTTVGGAGVAGRARLVLALEAAFGGAGAPSATARVVFARIRVRMDDLVPGASYTVTHPYGVTDPLEADDRGRVFWTDDRGIADQTFDTVVRDGLVAPFLRWTSGAAKAPGEVDPDPGFLGDGATEHTVTGSPFGTNFFRIDGPSVGAAGGPRDPADPANVDRVQWDRFTVQGREATRLGVRADRATYHRQAGAIHLDVLATTPPGRHVEMGGPGLPRVLLAEAGGHHAARVTVPALPTSVDLLAVDDEPVTRTSIDVVHDQVSITRADLDVVAGTLAVEAASSDDQTAQLTVTDHGPLPPGATATAVFATAAAAAQVTVTSSSGGSASAPVRLVGGSVPVLPGVLADAGADSTAVESTTVRLDGSASRGDIASYAWVQTAGAPTALSDASAAEPTFTAPAAPDTCTFDLTVTGPGGVDSDTVSVTIAATPPPDQLVVDRCEFRTGAQQLRVEGTRVGAATEVLVEIHGLEVGRSAVDLAGAWSVRRTLGAADAALRPLPGDTAEATTSFGGLAVTPIRIRG